MKIVPCGEKSLTMAPLFTNLLNNWEIMWEPQIVIIVGLVDPIFKLEKLSLGWFWYISQFRIWWLYQIWGTMRFLIHQTTYLYWKAYQSTFFIHFIYWVTFHIFQLMVSDSNRGILALVDEKDRLAIWTFSSGSCFKLCCFELCNNLLRDCLTWSDTIVYLIFRIILIGNFEP